MGTVRWLRMPLILKRILVYLGTVFLFGTLRGLSSETKPHQLANYVYFEGYLLFGLLWGAFYFNSEIRGLRVTEKIKALLTLITALAAGLIAFFFYKTFGSGEVIQDIKAGLGGDIKTYKEYPIKGYQLVGLLISVQYLVCGFMFWFLSLGQSVSAKKFR